MGYDPRGVRIVLTAPDTESTEKEFSPWKQMVYASVPARYAPRFMYKNGLVQETWPDGSAKVMPYGLRVTEAILLRHFPADDVVACHPAQLDQFVGPRTRVVGVSAHNPIGTAFSTGTYSNIFGSSARPINAAETERIFFHPAIRKHRPKVIVGGAGSWQIEKTGMFDRLGVDSVIIGRGEGVIADLFQRAIDGEDLPKVARPPEPKIDEIVIPNKRSTYGIAEMTRGCGRQCAFCSPTLETRISVPPEQLIECVKANVRDGGKVSFPVSEDIFIYGAAAPFYIPNADAMVDFYERVANVPGLDYVALSHATIAPALVNPHLIKELSRILLPKSALRNRHSTEPGKRVLSPLIGLETGSPRLAAMTMAGKALPYDIRDWPDIVVEGIRILNENNWYPVCTFIIGLPNETEDDIKLSLDMLHRLRKFHVLYVPSVFTPLEDTRMANAHGLKARELSKLQWEFMLTAWKMSRDSWARPGSNELWKWGMRAFYYARGKWIHGSQFKYPAFRFAGFDEEKISKHLYLKWNQNGTPEIPAKPPRMIAKHRGATGDELNALQKGQPFNIFGTTRVETPQAMAQTGD